MVTFSTFQEQLPPNEFDSKVRPIADSDPVITFTLVSLPSFTEDGQTV